MSKYTYRSLSTDNFNARWDTPYGSIIFAKDSPMWGQMVVPNGREKQAKIMEAIHELQEMIVMETGKSPTITIS